MVTFWIRAGTLGAALAVAVLGLRLAPGYIRLPLMYGYGAKGDIEAARLYVQMLPLFLPSMSMLIVAALLGATRGEHTANAGLLMNTAGAAFLIAYLFLAMGSENAVGVGGFAFFLGWLLLLLSTFRFGRWEHYDEPWKRDVE